MNGKLDFGLIALCLTITQITRDKHVVSGIDQRDTRHPFLNSRMQDCVYPLLLWDTDADNVASLLSYSNSVALKKSQN